MGLLTRLRARLGRGSAFRTVGAGDPTEVDRFDRGADDRREEAMLDPDVVGDPPKLNGRATAPPITEPKPIEPDREPLTEETAVALAEPHHPEPADEPHRRPAERQPSPRNKQELLEELQRSYREAVDLMRKVDDHLDRSEERQETLLGVARRVDEALPSLAADAGRTADAIVAMRGEITGAIADLAGASGEHAKEAHRRLGVIADQIDRTVQSNAQLTGTMAAFRETMGDLAGHSVRASEALESIERRHAEEHLVMVSAMASARRWSIAGFAVAGALGLVAIATAVAALVGVTG